MLSLTVLSTFFAPSLTVSVAVFCAAKLVVNARVAYAVRGRKTARRRARDDDMVSLCGDCPLDSFSIDNCCR